MIVSYPDPVTLVPSNWTVVLSFLEAYRLDKLMAYWRPRGDTVGPALFLDEYTEQLN